jgi:methyl coenzyme M reductase alpha subunit
VEVSFEQEITTSYTGDIKKASFFSAYEVSIEKNGLFKIEPVLEVVLEVKADRTLHSRPPHWVTTFESKLYSLSTSSLSTFAKYFAVLA